MDNKPPGADQDRSAPFNQPNYLDCTDCYGTGEVPDSYQLKTGKSDICSTCNGTGLIPE